jgi:hypothetical protein
VRAAGGIGFAAHPFSDGGHMLYPPLARRIVRPHGWPALEASETDTPRCGRASHRAEL